MSPYFFHQYYTVIRLPDAHPLSSLSIACSTYSLPCKTHQDLPSCRSFPLSNMPCFATPEQLRTTCQAQYEMVASSRGTLSPCSCRIFTRLNHFSLRLRPVGLLASCLTFGITPAGPMLAIRWLACLAGVGLTPTGINDLARPHTPIIPIINNY